MSPAPEPVRRNDAPIYSIGLGLCGFGIFLGVLLQHSQVGGQAGSIAALVCSVIGMGCLVGLLIGRDRPTLAGPAARERRENLRNYGVSFVACVVGVVAGLLLHRGGWGGSFGGIVAVLSGLLGLFCAGAFLWALKG